MGKKNNILQHAQQVKLIQNLEYENHKNKNRGWNWKTDVSLGVIYQHEGCFLPVETPKKLRKHLESLIVSSDPKHELYREKVLSKSAINLILEHLGGGRWIANSLSTVDQSVSMYFSFIMVVIK